MVFLQPDPAMEGTNHFAYAGCNPLKYMDPTGLTNQTLQGWGIACMVIGAILGVIAGICSVIPGGQAAAAGLAAAAGTLIGMGAAMIGGSNVTVTASVSVPIGDSGGGNTANKPNNNVSPGGGKTETSTKSDDKKKNEDNNPFTAMNVEKTIQEIPISNYGSNLENKDVRMEKWICAGTENYLSADAVMGDGVYLVGGIGSYWFYTEDLSKGFRQNYYIVMTFQQGACLNFSYINTVVSAKMSFPEGTSFDEIVESFKGNFYNTDASWGFKLPIVSWGVTFFHGVGGTWPGYSKYISFGVTSPFLGSYTVSITKYTPFGDRWFEYGN